MKIRITERGDPSIDFSWQEKIKDMDGIIVISKGFNPRFKKILLDNKDKIIYHCTITGLGSSLLEPNVYDYYKQLLNLEELVKDGFNPEHIVVRIDPIIPSFLYKKCISEKGDYRYLILSIICKARNLGIKRFRFSFLDLYQHIITRIKDRFNLNAVYSFKEKEKDEWIQYFIDIKNEIEDISFEACTEGIVPEEFKTGCISKKDFEILGLNSAYCIGSSHQRLGCLCPSCKTELLNSKQRCQHGCLYCYWKD